MVRHMLIAAAAVLTLLAGCRPPVAILTASPLSGEAPRTVDFDASASYDQDNNLNTYTFDFGDGSDPVTRTDPLISHRYDQPGLYTAVLTVTDLNGYTGQTSIDIEIFPNPLLNGDFESGSGSTPDHWTSHAWQPGPTFVWGTDTGLSGSRAVEISVEPTALNDAWWQQVVSLTPNTPYNIHGYIRGDAIVSNNVGANVCAIGTWDHSDSAGSVGSFDWKRMSVTFMSAPSGLATVGARLGFWASVAGGTMWADDLVLTSDDFMPRSYTLHFTMMLHREDLESIDRENYDRWIHHLDDAYEAYRELVGAEPFDGFPIGILSVIQYPGGWAVAGNPIRWQQRYVGTQLQRANDDDDWSFGILHEISHTFDLDGRWNWHAEFWANLKVYYVLDTLNARVIVDNQLYQGTALKSYYQSAHDAAVASGNYNWNALTFTWIEVTETIGWDPFKATFTHFSGLAGGAIPTTGLGKLNLFLDQLTLHAGTDVRALFPAVELAWMEANAI